MEQNPVFKTKTESQSKRETDMNLLAWAFVVATMGWLTHHSFSTNFALSVFTTEAKILLSQPF